MFILFPAQTFAWWFDNLTKTTKKSDEKNELAMIIPELGNNSTFAKTLLKWFEPDLTTFPMRSQSRLNLVLILSLTKAVWDAF